ncbi:MAG TPA: hypothetical protein VLD67_02540 [Vicinamibacterales bacterium]|nr:hypothetical protein [Vicinamibacterales bacterium]
MRIARRIRGVTMPAASFVLAAGLAGACSGRAADSPPRITLRTDTPAPVVDVTGLPRADLERLAGASLTPEQWIRLLRVEVSSGGETTSAVPPVAGSYAIAGEAIRFTPLFPLDPGRQYTVVFDPSRMPGARDGGTGGRIETVVSRPAEARAPSTHVERVYPTLDVLPENQLRMYIQFSAPMGLRGGLDHVRLLDERGNEVVDPFLPLDAEFWNADRTRYTVFFDPGRVKRGILPNKEMGRALEPGRRYTLVVSSEWSDAYGLPLKSSFAREFRVTSADERPLDTGAWRIEPPDAGSSAPLTVSFPEPLDHGLLMRALGVSRGGAPLAGEIRVEDAERRWIFTPRDPWGAGDHELVVLSFLEDLAGNRIGRAFEVDAFDRVDKGAEPERHIVPFRVAPGPGS